MRSADPATRDDRPLIVFAHKGHDWISGSEQCLLDLLEGLDRSRFRLLVLANSRVVRETRQRGVEGIYLAHWGGGSIAGAPWRMLMRRLLAQRSPALIHANMAVALPLLDAAARARGIPIVAHLHLPFASLGERHRALVRRSRLIVGVAEHVVAPLRSEGGVRERIRVIHNAVNADRLGDGVVARESLGIPGDAFVATSVGSLIRRKAQTLTVQALATVRATGVNAHLLLCGTGEDEQALRGRAQTLGIADAVHFLGRRSDVGPILRGATDVLVSSAREEAMPLSLLEAQWLGVPVIASDIPGHRDVLGHGERGMLVPTEAPDTLAAALCALADDPERRAALAEAAISHARDEYTMPRYVDSFAGVYEECLRPPSASRGERVQ